MLEPRSRFSLYTPNFKGIKIFQNCWRKSSPGVQKVPRGTFWDSRIMNQFLTTRGTFLSASFVLWQKRFVICNNLVCSGQCSFKTIEFCWITEVQQRQFWGTWKFPEVPRPQSGYPTRKLMPLFKIDLEIPKNTLFSAMAQPGSPEVPRSWGIYANCLTSYFGPSSKIRFPKKLNASVYR